MKTQRRKFTKEFKAQVAELVSAGKPVPEIAREFEIGSSLAYRRLNAKLQLENDILKKAAVILGTSPQHAAAR